MGGCATTPPAPSEAGQAQCFRLIAASEDGASLIEETGAPGFVRGEKPVHRFHLQRREDGDVRTETLTEQACRAQALCDARGAPDLAAFGLRAADSFGIGATTASRDDAGAITVELPELGPTKLRFAQHEDRFGDPAWMLTIDRDPEPWVLYRAPSRLAPSRVEWFRAGPYLWLQIETTSEGLGCLALTTDLREAAAGILDDDAVALLRKEQRDEAQALLVRAIAVSPGDATVAYNLACVLALKGEDDEAVAWLERALSFDRERRLAALARKDPDLQSLWTREDFLRLVAPDEGP